jgi:hypothetical protein
MSVNAFYGGFQNAQDALNAPRVNALNMERAALGNEQMRAQADAARQQQEAARQQQMLTQQREQAAFRIRGEAMGLGGQRRPMGGQISQGPSMMQPGAQQAPAALQGAQRPRQEIDPVTGQQIEVVQVTGSRLQPRLQMQDPQRELDALIRDAFHRGDAAQFNELIGQSRSMMTAEEQRGRQMIAIAAADVLRMDSHERRVAAVQQFMAENNIDPADTNLDDYFQNPEALENQLRIEMAKGNPSEAADAAISVNADRQREVDQQRFAPVQRFDLGNRQTAVRGDGSVANEFSVGVSPNAALNAQVARAGQANQAQIAQMQAGVRAQIAGADRELARLRIEIDRSQGAQQMDLRRQANAIEQRRVELTEQFMGASPARSMSVDDLVAIAGAQR